MSAPAYQHEVVRAGPVDVEPLVDPLMPSVSFRSRCAPGRLHCPSRRADGRTSRCRSGRARNAGGRLWVDVDLTSVPIHFVLADRRLAPLRILRMPALGLAAPTACSAKGHRLHGDRRRLGSQRLSPFSIGRRNGVTTRGSIQDNTGKLTVLVEPRAWSGEDIAAFAGDDPANSTSSSTRREVDGEGAVVTGPNSGR